MSITRRELLKIGASAPFLPVLSNPEIPSKKRSYETVYKFTTKGMKSFCSTFHYVNKYIIKYKLNVEIFPKYGKLFIFKTKQSMNKWIYNNFYQCNVRCFECKGFNIQPITKRVSFLSDSNFDSYWEDPNLCEYENMNCNIMICDSIILEKEIPCNV